MKKFSLPLLLLVACSQHRSPTPPTPSYGGDQVMAQDVTWTQLVNASASGSTISKSGGQQGYADAGGTSAQSLGGGDGWLEFTVGDTAPFRFVGLAHPHGGTGAGDIDFAFRMQAGHGDVYELGAWTADNTVASGDTLRIAVHAGVVTYSKNGNAIYTSAKTPSYPLAAYAVLIDSPSAIDSAKLALDSPTPTTGTFVTGVAAQPAADGTAASVTWTTNVATDGQVQYGATTSYGTWSIYAPVTSTSHSIDVTDLVPGTTYHYRVRSQDAGGNAVYSADATFITPSTSPSPNPNPNPTPTPTPTPAANAHKFCGWLQATGWVPADQDPWYQAFAAHADEFDAVHPMWYYLTSTTTLKAGFGEGSSLVLSNTTAGGKRTKLIPTIAAVDGSQPQWASQMIHDATLRAQHEAAIVNLVVGKGYDGIDLDYEHLPDSDKDAFSTFAEELGAQLHAKGKTLSFAVGALITDRYGHWDYTRLSAVADQLHVMGYDYHGMGSHPGPVAPLGWIQQVLGYINTIGGGTRSSKFILGLPNYGCADNGSGTNNYWCQSMDCINLVSGSYSTTTNHMNVCPLTNGVPTASGRAPNAASSKGQLYFDDIASHEEKVAAAQKAGLGGITYWTIGGEPDRPGPRTWFQMIRAYFPR